MVVRVNDIISWEKDRPFTGLIGFISSFATNRLDPTDLYVSDILSVNLIDYRKVVGCLEIVLLTMFGISHSWSEI